MASIESWTHSAYTAYYTCGMICDLNSLLKRKYFGSILIISEIINILSKHNQKFVSPSQERFTESAWSLTPNSNNSFTCAIDRLDKARFHSTPSNSRQGEQS